MTAVNRIAADGANGVVHISTDLLMANAEHIGTQLAMSIPPAAGGDDRG